VVKTDARQVPNRGRQMPWLRFFGYYAVIVAAAAVLIRYVPAVRQAFVSEIVATPLPGRNELLSELPAAPAPGGVAALDASLERILTTSLIALGTLALVLPVAWVYMFTRRFRYDRSLVQSVIILPLVVGGMVMIVRNSLALAFSLFGIVAAVRFRNTLKDPRDAVYIFLALGLGLAAGVNALDIALVMSLSFNLVVLGLWKSNLGSVYGGGVVRDMLAMGDPSLRRAPTPPQRRALSTQLKAQQDGMEAHGVLLIQSADPETAQTAADAALSAVGKEWRFLDSSTVENGGVLVPVLVRFKDKATPVQLLNELDEYWAGHVTAAEYLPFAAGEEGHDGK
jgi:hypothetical protein